jgi:hypothetical protein
MALTHQIKLTIQIDQIGRKADLVIRLQVVEVAG